MKTINILEENDTIDPEDWCRPLILISMSGGLSDSYAFTNCYSGLPENNVKWVKVRKVFGECWFGKKVKEVLENLPLYEFVRGDIPKSHLLTIK